MASIICQKDETEPSCTVHLIDEAEVAVTPLAPVPAYLPIWPRILTASLHILVVLSSAAIIGLLAHTLTGYSGSRGIKFGGNSVSWPSDLDLHPAVFLLVITSISMLNSVVWSFLTLFRLKRPSFSPAEVASIMLSLGLLILWLAADFLENRSEHMPKKSLLLWACRRESSPTNVLVRYRSICEEQLAVKGIAIVVTLAQLGIALSTAAIWHFAEKEGKMSSTPWRARM